MATTSTPRFGMKQFSSGADPHPTRLEHNAMIGFIESNAAIYSQGTLAARPTAGKVGRYFWATDTKRLYADDGIAWNEVSPIGGGGAGLGVVIGGAGTEGTAERAARADHSHAIPLVTVSANGAMLAADKKKLDAATANATANTLVIRNSAGAISVATPTATSHATTKAYVDGRIQEAADYADDAVYAIPFASSTEYGHMTAADKIKLDAATRWNTPGTVVMRDTAGNFSSYPPKTTDDVANKGYVDAETAKRALAAHKHAAADLPVASSTGAGTMSAADKDKLDAATPSISAPSTIVMRDGESGIQVPNPTNVAHAARKSYVDAETAKKANAAHSHGAGDLPTVSQSAPGIMTAADKVKLDGAESTGVASRIMMRDSAGRSRVATPSHAGDIAPKGYVDAQVATRAAASHSHGAGDLPVASSTGAGTMSAADKAKLDAATRDETANALAMRGGSGEINVGVTSAAANAARKDYVDAQVATRAAASHNHSGANITSGTVAAARLPVASSSAAGTMSAADKAKLDAAAMTAAVSTIAMRDANGNLNAATPTATGHVAIKSYVDAQVATKAASSHNHSGANITSGTVPAARLPLATTAVSGAMSADDKSKLDIAGSAAYANRLVLRDSRGSANFKAPVDAENAANKSYVDTAVKPLADNHVVHYTNESVIAGVVKPAASPWKHFVGPVLISTGGGGATRTTPGATDANGYGGIWFGYDSIPKFSGIIGAQMTTKSSAEGYLSTIAVLDVNTTRLKFRAAAQKGGIPAFNWGQLLIWLDIWGW